MQLARQVNIIKKYTNKKTDQNKSNHLKKR